MNVMCICALIILTGCGKDLDCGGKAAQDSVAQIARNNKTMVLTALMQFLNNNPPPMTPERAAANQAKAAYDAAVVRVREASRRAWAAAGQNTQGINEHSSAPPLPWQGGDCRQSFLRGAAANCDTNPPPEVAAKLNAVKAANAVTDAARKDADAAQEVLNDANKAADAADNARASAIGADVQKEMKYTLDVIRTTAKDQGTGALTCAATLNGEAGKYGAAKLPITYKVEKTSDGKLYVTVYGLQP
jgi:hypothetical protein